MIFAAKEAVERRAMEKGRKVGLEEGRQEGLQEGRQEERERIAKALEQHGVEIPPEVARLLARESGQHS